MLCPVGISHNRFIIRIVIGLIDAVPILMNGDPVEKLRTVIQQINIPVQICKRCRRKLCLRIYMLDHLR